MNGKAHGVWFVFNLAFIAASLSTGVAGPAQTQQLASANADFAFKLLKEVAREQPGRNIFISPYGVSTALQMVGNGAEGRTREELDRALGTTGLDEAGRNQANLELSNMLRSQSTNVLLYTANALWYRKGLPVKPEFIARNERFYYAKVAGLDFNDPASVETMNSWVNQMTRGRIPGMFSSPLNPDTSLCLANAVYFKCKWLIPFELKDTKDWDFHPLSGPLKKVPMMFRSDSFFHRQSAGYQAVRLDYRDARVGMYVFLPDTNSSPEKTLEVIAGKNWLRVIVPGFREAAGRLRLPRFEFEYGLNLNPPLHALGIETAFTENANFSRLCGKPVNISDVAQKTFVEVDEEGTEAVAVTELRGWTAGLEIERPRPFEMIVDRPFIVVIEHTKSKAILFMGIVFDPAAIN